MEHIETKILEIPSYLIAIYVLLGVGQEISQKLSKNVQRFQKTEFSETKNPKNFDPFSSENYNFHSTLENLYFFTCASTLEMMKN